MQVFTNRRRNLSTWARAGNAAEAIRKVAPWENWEPAYCEAVPHEEEAACS